MLRLLFILYLLTAAQIVWSQKAYFQQETDYTIDVSLDDADHILRGFEKIKYTNHSPDTLRFIYFHLWPNAYKNDRSAFTQQEVENRKTGFYFSKQDDKGFIDSLQFMVNEQKVSYSNYNDHEDVIVLDLNDALPPGETIEISTPFRVVIPLSFSRLGHSGQNYEISQWYPKPAVYDRNGWHPMPYLNQGEFYSEYGSFQVTIHLPSNYIVASTGDLQEASEKAFIDSLCKSNGKSTIALLDIPSSPNQKTISFKQNKVHDFAWFASKNYQIEHHVANIQGRKAVDCYSYYYPGSAAWYQGSAELIARTIEFLSAHVGEYPYAHASVVDGSIAAGEGMEYPNVALLGIVRSAAMLRQVLIHEVGHNWFYGILGNNERDYPWMDESINSFYEAKINKAFQTISSKSRLQKAIGRILMNTNHLLNYQIEASNNRDQELSNTSEAFTDANYNAVVYQKGAALFAYLEQYLGSEVFERCMKRYYNEWKFKHPYPEDFRRIVEQESQKNLNWFFDEALNTTRKIDFKLRSVKKEGNLSRVKAGSMTNFTGPIPIQALQGDSIISTKWINAPYDSTANFLNLPEGITRFTIDAGQTIPELRINNNSYRTKSLSHKFRPALRYGTGIGLSAQTKLFLLPALGFNTYDRRMLGGVLHNLCIPNHRVQFALMPFYSTGAKQLTGSGLLAYSLYPKRLAHRVSLALQGRSYHHAKSNLNIPSPLFLRHIKIMPSITVDFNKSSPRSRVNNILQLRYYYLHKEKFNYTLNTIDSLYRPQVTNDKNLQAMQLNFMHKNDRTFNPYHYKAAITGNAEFLKATLEGQLRIDYNMKDKAFYVRAFAGKFFELSSPSDPFAQRNQFLNTTYTAANDFLYDQVFLGRDEQKGVVSKQISMQEGAFKIPSNLLSNPIGQSNDWLTSLNIKSDLPIKLPFKIQLFADAATLANASKLNSSGNKVLFDGGVELHVLNDILVLYAPLLMSKDFKDYTKSIYPSNRLLNTISFCFHVDQLNWTKTDKLFNLYD